ncbi:hypothetical protein IWQ62_003092 [Dispira parvispora]|uniref:RING-type E3 ubiquitin transferase n=1 Tax=Dispira parvispora TaxID=1520584 RepID=A0A9W8E6L0_9FUNG|nr:hypothetical protein IWQ62_003092 [Dispira parvispora]
MHGLWKSSTGPYLTLLTAVAVAILGGLLRVTHGRTISTLEFRYQQIVLGDDDHRLISQSTTNSSWLYDGVVWLNPVNATNPFPPAVLYHAEDNDIEDKTVLQLEMDVAALVPFTSLGDLHYQIQRMSNTSHKIRYAVVYPGTKTPNSAVTTPPAWFDAFDMSAVFVDSPLGTVLRNGIQAANETEAAALDEDTEGQSVWFQLWLLPSRPGHPDNSANQQTQSGMASWKIVLIVVLPLFLLVIPGICMIIYIRRRRARNLTGEHNLGGGGIAGRSDSMVSKPDSHVLDQKRLEDFPLITLTDDNIRELTGRAMLTGLLRSSRITGVPPESGANESPRRVVNDDDDDDEKSMSNVLGEIAQTRNQEPGVGDDISLDILSSGDMNPTNVDGSSPTNPSSITTGQVRDYPSERSVFEPLAASRPSVEAPLAVALPPGTPSGHVSDSDSVSLEGEIRRATTLRRAPAYSISRVHTLHLTRVPASFQLRKYSFKSKEAADSLIRRNSAQITAGGRSVVNSLYNTRPRKVKSIISYSPHSGEQRKVDPPSLERKSCSSSRSTDHIYSELPTCRRSRNAEYPKPIHEPSKSKQFSTWVPPLRSYVTFDQQPSVSSKVSHNGNSWPANLHRATELIPQRSGEPSSQCYTRLLSSRTVPSNPFDSDEDDRSRVDEVLPRSEPRTSIEISESAPLNTTEDYQQPWSALESSANSANPNSLGNKSDSLFSLGGYSKSASPAENTTVSVGTSSDRLRYCQQPLQLPQRSSDPLPLSSSNSFIMPEDSSPICIICLEPLSIGVTIRQLPCGHVYHPPCIDVWLTQKSVQCPLCKYDCQVHVDALLSHADSTVIL